MTKTTISVIIPCYNEASSIANVINSLPKEITEVIVVDNNSMDNTAEIARKLGAIVVSEKKQGYGAAIKTGLRSAQADYVVVIDGDGQYPTHKIIPMLGYLQEKNADFVSGNRFPLIENGSMKLIRRWGNWFLTSWTNFLFKFDNGIEDSQSGMWLFKRKILEQITLTSDDMSLSEEIKIRAASNPGLRFVEFHIPYHNRGGISKLSPIKHGIKNLLFLIQLRMEKTFRRVDGIFG